MSRHKERSPKPDGFGLLVEKFALRRVIEISALGELGSTTGGLQTVLLFTMCPETIVYQRLQTILKKLAHKLALYSNSFSGWLRAVSIVAARSAGRWYLALA